MPRLLAPLLALALLSACQLSLPGRDPASEAPTPVTGGAITTTTLDAAPAAASTTPTEQAPIATATPADPRPQPRPASPSEPPAAAQAAAPAEPPAAPPEIPAALKSASQIACEKDKGRWARAGEGGGMACIYQTRDGGKRCDSKDDCQGECLARSRTCSPIRPLFGCNAVLLDTGAEVTLCLD